MTHSSTPSNKVMKLTKPGQIGASQLIAAIETCMIQVSLPKRWRRLGRGAPLFDVVLQDTVASADPDSLEDFVLHPPSNSKSAMPACDKALTKDQVSDVVSYLKMAGGH